MHYNFITPDGLKVRIHAPVIFSLVKGAPCDNDPETMLNDTKISGALHLIDALFSFRCCYTWYFSLFFLITGSTSALYFFGCISLIYALCVLFPLVPFRLTPIDHICHWLYFPYYLCRSDIVRYGIFIAAALLFRHPIVILWYALFFVGYNVFDFILTHRIGGYTKKKYGYALTDAELCAFRVVYIYLNNDSDWIAPLSLHSRADIIKWYFGFFEVMYPEHLPKKEPSQQDPEKIPKNKKIGFAWRKYTESDWDDFRERWHKHQK